LFIFREAERQVSPVTMSCSSLRAAAPPCLQLFIKTPEGGKGAFCLWLVLGAFAFGFWLGFFTLGFGFRLFGVGSFWKGKEFLKGNC
jgi:hypothetical protein